ncbi:MAG TPA: lytic transglycosylase domain-containing protein [Acetobacteraceae bacterium]|nr:lytic transglycosylase domain-containing protein [Acetobacteraceae bacterium]
MRLPTRPALVLFVLACAAGTAAAQQVPAAGRDPIAAIRADRWADAQADAAGFADPVAEKLVLYYRLLAPRAATPAAIAGFMHANPDWPNQALLERRRQDAIAADPDDADALAQCAAAPVTEVPALLRCADALAVAGQASAAIADARKAWITGITDPVAEASFLHRWAASVTQADQWVRFQHMAWRNQAAAARQVARLDPAHRPEAEARLAFQRDDPHAEALLAAAHLRQSNHPGLMFDHARCLRRAGRVADAVALWKRDGAAAQNAIGATAPEHLRAFWAERNLLARSLLADGDAADAYAIASLPGAIAPRSAVDAEFLAGFIALRKLDDPGAALRHFRKLATLSKAAITQARAWYWQGRAAAAAGKDPKPDYEKAAGWPTAFYGQLAALALGDDAAALARRIDALRDPTWTRGAVLDFTGHEVVRAAAWLVAWGDPQRARAFLLRMDALAPDPADRALTAALALRVGLPDTAVFIARRMGIDGLMLPDQGWPMPFDPPRDALDPAVALGIMRQESSFDVGAVSSSGALGLMQLMPFTADAVAQQLGVGTSLVALTRDPERNMRLGTEYLRQMLNRFGGSLPLAVAAYNAGPHRVEQWLAQNGDPRVGPVDMIDWIEQIPVGETRNYVQRVLENITIYRARRGDPTPTLLATWAR